MNFPIDCARRAFLPVALLALTAPCLAFGGKGASVGESKIKNIVYVDQATGGESNPGTKAQPVKTIVQGFHIAGALLGKGQGVKLVIRPGIYREALGFGPDNAYKAPFVMEGTDRDKCIVTGSDRWTGWDGPDAAGVYSKPWPYKWGVSLGFADAGMPEEMRRYENVIVDGRMYFPKLKRETLVDATFYVDESQAKLYVKPPKGVDLNAAARDVEVTTRIGEQWDAKGNRRDASLLHFYRSEPAQRTVPANLVVRKLTFQNSPTGTALMLQNITNALVEDCRFRNNGYSGLGISGNRLTVRRCLFEDNGSIGFGADGDDILIEDCRTVRTCAKGAAYGWAGWDSAGFKCGSFTNSTVRRLTARDNFTIGIWFDTTCLNDLLEDCDSSANTAYGIFWENNNRNTIPNLGAQITGVIRNCRFTNNGDAGIFISECENTVIDRCQLIGNAAQIGMYNGTNPPRGIISSVAFHDCTLAALTDKQAIFSIDDNHPSPSWTDQFLPGLRQDAVYNTNHNRYYSPRPTPFRDAAGKETLTFAGWHEMHAAKGHADRDSVFLKAPPKPAKP